MTPARPAARTAADARLPHLPGLDGLRGLAVLAVLVFHADLGLRGGHLGVSVFFTLSGFLITSLLLLERARTGRVDLRAFWGRRARRLVPAVLLSLPLVAVVVALSPTPATGSLIGDGVAALGWFANWRFVLDQQSYADLFSLPSPFQHFWSLAVEEQFYLVFPLLLVLVVGRSRARGAAALRLGRQRLGVVLAGLVVLSTAQAFRLFGSDVAFSRSYYGTDTRGAELLVGALLALAVVGPRGLRTLPRALHVPSQIAGVGALAGLAAASWCWGTGDSALYRGGLLLVAGCTATVLLAVAQPGSEVGAMLAWRPLVRLGAISYGVYVFHWPVFLLLTRTLTGLPGLPLFALRAAVTLALATASYVLVEQPVRRGALPVVPSFVGWGGGLVVGMAALVLASGQLVVPGPAANPDLVAAALPPAALLLAPTSPQAGSSASTSPWADRSAPAQLPMAAPTPRPASTPTPSPTAAPRQVRQSGVPAQFVEDPKKSTVPPPPAVPPGALRVAVVGDSVGRNLGAGLVAWAAGRSDVAVYNLAVPACPLTRGGDRRISESLQFPVESICRWWDTKSERRARFEQFRPDVVVVEDGINSFFDRRLPQFGGWRRPGDAEFDQWAGSEYQALRAQWGAHGARLLVLNTPCGDWGRYERFNTLQDPAGRVAAMNSGVFASMAGVTPLDLFAKVCPDGQFTDDLEGYHDGRPDGFHFSTEVSQALARDWLGPAVLALRGP